jgi:hypothetical protein
VKKLKYRIHEVIFTEWLTSLSTSIKNTTKVCALLTENRGSASHQSSANLAKQFQRRRLLEIRQSETRIVWRPCLSMDRDEMCNLYRRPSIVASYQISNKVKLSRKHLWKVLYNDDSFRSDPLTNMVATGDSCFWSADLNKNLLL